MPTQELKSRLEISILFQLYCLIVAGQEFGGTEGIPVSSFFYRVWENPESITETCNLINADASLHCHIENIGSRLKVTGMNKVAFKAAINEYVYVVASAEDLVPNPEDRLPNRVWETMRVAPMKIQVQKFLDLLDVMVRRYGRRTFEIFEPDLKETKLLADYKKFTFQEMLIWCHKQGIVKIKNFYSSKRFDQNNQPFPVIFLEYPKAITYGPFTLNLETKELKFSDRESHQLPATQDGNIKGYGIVIKMLILAQGAFVSTEEIAQEMEVYQRDSTTEQGSPEAKRALTENLREWWGESAAACIVSDPNRRESQGYKIVDN